MLRAFWTWLTGSSVPAWSTDELLSGSDAHAARLGFIEHFGGDERFVGLVALQGELPERQRAV